MIEREGSRDVRSGQVPASQHKPDSEASDERPEYVPPPVYPIINESQTPDLVRKIEEALHRDLAE